MSFKNDLFPFLKLLYFSFYQSFIMQYIQEFPYCIADNSDPAFLILPFF